METELAEMKAKEQLARVDAEVVRRQLVAAQTQNQAEAELDAEAHSKVCLVTTSHHAVWCGHCLTVAPSFRCLFMFLSFCQAPVCSW